jgi:hypothetical protein
MLFFLLFRVCATILTRVFLPSRKTHGTFEGTDKRGKHTPANKTSDETLDSIRQHIMSFPIMDSHYKRKDTNRKCLQHDLSITKMYDLFKAKCTAEEIIPASSITYRRVFCNEFNFSFHKLKKTLVSIVMHTRKRRKNLCNNHYMLYTPW